VGIYAEGITGQVEVGDSNRDVLRYIASAMSGSIAMARAFDEGKLHPREKKPPPDQQRTTIFIQERRRKLSNSFGGIGLLVAPSHTNADHPGVTLGFLEMQSGNMEY